MRKGDTVRTRSQGAGKGSPAEAGQTGFSGQQDRRKLHREKTPEFCRGPSSTVRLTTVDQHVHMRKIPETWKNQREQFLDGQNGKC